MRVLRVHGVFAVAGVVSCSSPPRTAPVQAPPASITAHRSDAHGCVADDAARAAEYRDRVAREDHAQDASPDQVVANVGGAEGIASRLPRVVHRDMAGHVIMQDLPVSLADALAAREAYLGEVPAPCNPDLTADYALYVGSQYALYGHFDQARH
jgi:hypothetical protein